MTPIASSLGITLLLSGSDLARQLHTELVLRSSTASSGTQIASCGATRTFSTLDRKSLSRVSGDCSICSAELIVIARILLFTPFFVFRTQDSSRSANEAERVQMMDAHEAQSVLAMLALLCVMWHMRPLLAGG